MGLLQDRLSIEQTLCSDCEAKRQNNADACHLVVWPEEIQEKTAWSLE
jgi:hypothetical protein